MVCSYSGQHCRLLVNSLILKFLLLSGLLLRQRSPRCYRHLLNGLLYEVWTPLPVENTGLLYPNRPGWCKIGNLWCCRQNGWCSDFGAVCVPHIGGWSVQREQGGRWMVGREGRVGRNSYLTSAGKQAGGQTGQRGNILGRTGGNSGEHAHLRLIIVLVPVFNHRASTLLLRSFLADPTRSIYGLFQSEDAMQKHWMAHCRALHHAHCATICCLRNSQLDM